MPKLRDVSKEDFIAAIEKNNYEQGVRQLFRYVPATNTIRACALGQGLLNAHVVSPKKLLARLIENYQRRGSEINIKEESKWIFKLEILFGTDFVNDVIEMNDSLKKSCPEIAAALRENQ